MDVMKLSEEIETLLAAEKIDEEAAIRLMLVSQRELLERMKVVEAVATANGEYLANYPSITWLWSHRRKTTVVIVIAVFLALYFLLSPVTISDIRHAILEALGLPVDLGLNGG
jgi:hypothetical protein